MWEQEWQEGVFTPTFTASGGKFAPFCTQFCDKTVHIPLQKDDHKINSIAAVVGRLKEHENCIKLDGVHSTEYKLTPATQSPSTQMCFCTL